MSIITLTTDLGLTDHYTGAIKGKILTECKEAVIVDISNQIRPYDAFHAAFVIKNAYSEFPTGTIHIINVVGSESMNSPRYILIKHEEQYFIGHDNGILALVFDNEPGEIYELDINDPEKITFPGRDVMAVVGCKLMNGATPEELGKRTYSLQALNVMQPLVTEQSIRGNVIYIDHYDNAMINISKDIFENARQGRRAVIYFKRENIYEISDRYNAVAEGEKLALFNAAGYLEIAINKGKAASLLGLRINDVVQIDLE